MASPVDERSSTKYHDAGGRYADAGDKFGSSGYVSLLPPPSAAPKKWPRTWNVVVVVLFVCALFISGLLLGYYIRHLSVEGDTKKPEKLCLKPPAPMKGGPRHLELLHENLMYTMSGDKQAAYLRNYAAKQVYSGSESDQRLAKLLRLYFNKYGFDDVEVKKVNEKYNALLSLPDVNKPNEVHMVGADGTVIYSDPTLKLPEEKPGGIKGFVDPPTEGSVGSQQEPPEGASGEDVPEPEVTSQQGNVSGTSATGNSSSSESARRRRAARRTDFGNMEDELLDLNDDSITPELIEKLKKMGSEPMPLPIPALPPFVAYSPPGEVTAGLVYVGYGGPEEYGVLQKEEMPLRGRIAIARIGNQTIREKVRQAEGRGIVGLLLYMDPADDFISPFKGCNDSIALWATANDDDKGDPLTPDYPAIDGMVRLDIKESSVPKIPVQTVSCPFAHRVLGAMSGLKAPAGWEGGINITYYAGLKEGPDPFKVKMSIHNRFTRQPIYNVIATLTGTEEPDKYVMVGANRNSFGLGPFGGVFGTAGLVEIARNLGILINREHWRPKRTIVLSSWGGGDYGNVGIIEYLQEFGKVLTGRIVSYINLDQPVLGNYSLRVASTPTLHKIIYNAAERVPSPDDKQSMLYDTWLDHSADVTDDFQPLVLDHTDPRLMKLPDPFFAKLGVPSTHIQYMPRHNKAFDISLIAEEMSHHWRYHNTVNRVSGLLMLSLVDADILQYDLEAMARKLTDKVTDWLSDNDFVENGTANALLGACDHLVTATAAMRHFILHLADYDVPTEKRLLNERLIDSENIMSKAFLHIEVLRIKLMVVKKLSATGKELPVKKAEYERQLAELQDKKRKLAAERKALNGQTPETWEKRREKQQKNRALVDQIQNLSKPIRALKVEIFKIEQQELSIQILAVTIFTKNDFSELLSSLMTAKQVLKTEL